MRRRIYISGPLTSSGNVMENLDRAMHAARAPIDAGFAPFCPHLTYHVDPGEEYPHDLWMAIELPWVSAADALEATGTQQAQSWTAGFDVRASQWA